MSEVRREKTGRDRGLISEVRDQGSEGKRQRTIHRLRTPEEYAPLSQVNSTGQGLHGLGERGKDRGREGTGDRGQGTEVGKGLRIEDRG